MNPLNCNPGFLRKKISTLSSIENRTIEQAEALTEAKFRLALSKDTPVEEAISLLKYSNRVDGINPRYTYHLARIYFNHGEFDQASDWLKKAAVSCPTSHRIWSHISLLQKQIDKQYRGDERYEQGVLFYRAKQINQGIINGNDHFNESLMDFIPPKSLAVIEAEARSKGRRLSPKKKNKQEQSSEESSIRKRMNNPGVCRWSGTIDLEIEDLFEKEPSSSTRNKILKQMENLLKSIKNRKDGSSAFVSLAVELLLTGPGHKQSYSVKIVRRLLSQLDANKTNDPAFELLEDICVLFEADQMQLPQLLAQSLKKKKIPALICALIHSKRLLYQPLAYKAQERYLEAKKYLKSRDKTTDNKELIQQTTAGFIKKMMTSLSALNAPQPDAIEDIEQARTAVQIDAATVLERLEYLNQSCQTANQLRNQANVFLKETLQPEMNQVADDQTCSRFMADFNAFMHFLDRVDDISATGLDLCTKLSGYVEKLDARDLGKGFSQALETCKKAYVDLKNRKGKKSIKKAAKAVQKYGSEFTVIQVAPKPGITQLSACLPPLGREDTSSEEKTGPDKIVQDLIRDTGDIKERLELSWQDLQELTAIKKQGELSDENIEKGYEIRQFIENLGPRAEKGLTELEKVRQAGVYTDIQTLDTLVKFYQNISVGKYKKKIKNLSLPEKMDVPTEQNPSSSEPETKPVPSPDNEPLTGIDGLKKAIKKVDSTIAQLVSTAMDSFDIYDDNDRQCPAIQTLETMVISRASLLFFRLEHFDKARDLWNRLLWIDSMNLSALNNLAVWHSMFEKDHAAVLLGWKKYCETLYFYDVVLNNPKEHAIQRADFHKNMASAYSCGYIFETGQSDKKADNKDAFISLINRPGSLDEFVSHKLLEMFNEKLTFSSPTLFIGVERNAKPAVRKDAYKAMTAYTKECCKVLPERIRDRFTRLGENAFSNAFDHCKTPEGLVLSRNKGYHREENRLIRWLSNVYMIKKQFFLSGNQIDWETKINHLDFLSILDRINIIPTTLSEDYQYAAVRSLEPGDPNAISRRLDAFVEEMALKVLIFILQGQEDLQEKREKLLKSFLSGFHANADFWDKMEKGNSQFDKIFNAFDDATFLYPEHVKQALSRKQETVDKNAVKILENLHEQYPWLSGPALHLAILFNQAGDAKKTIPILGKVIEKGFRKKGKIECQKLLDQIRIDPLIESKEYDKALRIVRTYIEKPDAGQHWVQVLMKIYSAMIENTPVQAKDSLEQIEKDFSHCMIQKTDNETEKKKNTVITENKRQLMVNAAIKYLDIEKGNSWPQAIDELNDLIQIDSENYHAVNYLMIACFQYAIKLANDGNLDDAVQHLNQAEHYSQQIIKESDNPSLEKQADDIQDKIRDAKSKLGRI